MPSSTGYNAEGQLVPRYQWPALYCELGEAAYEALVERRRWYAKWQEEFTALMKTTEDRKFLKEEMRRGMRGVKAATILVDALFKERWGYVPHELWPVELSEELDDCSYEMMRVMGYYG